MVLNAILSSVRVLNLQVFRERFNLVVSDSYSLSVSVIISCLMTFKEFCGGKIHKRSMESHLIFTFLIMRKGSSFLPIFLAL